MVWWSSVFIISGVTWIRIVLIVFIIQVIQYNYFVENKIYIFYFVGDLQKFLLKESEEKVCVRLIWECLWRCLCRKSVMWWCCDVGVEWRHWCTCWIQICQKDLDFLIALGTLVFIHDWKGLVNVKKILYSKISSPFVIFFICAMKNLDFHSHQHMPPNLFQSFIFSFFLLTIWCLLCFHLSIITTIQC